MSSEAVFQDRLKQIFFLRKVFIRQLKNTIPTAMPEDIDPTSKEGQQYLRDLALHGVEEMFEALQHLKNWKPHKLTEEKEFNKEEFLEEIVDAFNYFMALLIVVDVDHEKLFEAYLKKDQKIRKRLDEGY